MTSSNIYFSPCKVNYALAITGVRPDGFHNLTSLVAPTKLGDTLSVKEAKKDEISCKLEGVPCDETNLVMKAAILFREATGLKKFFKFDLQKNVPHGAGLGGGSSNGAIALKEINALCGSPLSLEQMEKIAAAMGSDCPLFLSGRPVIMRGRGEEVSFLPAPAEALIKSLKLLIFKPAFGINTGWAYKRMRENGKLYIPEAEAEFAINSWLNKPAIENLPLINNMQFAAFEKYPALETLLDFVRKEYEVPAIMSGSGSACFAIVNKLDACRLQSLKRDLLERLGTAGFVSEA